MYGIFLYFKIISEFFFKKCYICIQTLYIIIVD